MTASRAVPWIALILLAAAPAAGSELFPARPVELPAVETADRLARCLESSGYDILGSESTERGVRITARRGEGIRTILVSPRSPLASDVDWGPAEPAASGTGGYPDGLGACIENGGGTPEVLAAAEFVVCLRARRDGGEIRFSGFLVGKEGTILTTAHDLDRVEAVSVRLRDGRVLPGTVGERDPARDLLRIDLAEPVPGFSIEGRVRDRLAENEPVYSLGCTDGGAVRLREGRVAGKPRRSGGMPLWEVRMETIPGSSGGPAFDGKGNLAGLVKGRYRGTRYRGYLIPVATIRDFLGTARRRGR